MSDSDRPMSPPELREALHELLFDAHGAGVHVGDRAFAFEYDDPDIPDYEVLITRVDGDGFARD